MNDALMSAAQGCKKSGLSWVPGGRELGLLATYAAGFAMAHSIAAGWGGEGFYSVWYPAAGMRLALIWYAGVRLTPAIAVAEILVDMAKGVVTLQSPDLALVLLGIVRPVFAYGAAVWAIRWLAGGSRANLFVAPMPFGLAAVAAPNLAAIAALPFALWRPDLTNVESAQEVILSLTAFAVGDLMGVLMLAPPLLWMAEMLTHRRPVRMRVNLRLACLATVESALFLAGAFAITETMRRVGLGVQLMPAILAVAWIGLRFGRAAAWISLAIVAMLMLPHTAQDMSTAIRLQLHLGLATVVVVGYLAGSFADAQRRARADVRRRDRMLFQAERLKTLRAMSVAVIHEISQPLSTLAIEAKHLHEITGASEPEVAESAALIDRKAATLSHLVRRLRRYGGRAVDEPMPLPLSALIESVMALSAAEAKTAGVKIKVDMVDPDLCVLGQEVELAQAVINLLRNAMQAASDASVRISAIRSGEYASIAISNRHDPDLGPTAGMGVGTLIARAIVEAHGGILSRKVATQGVVSATISLPLIGQAT